MAWIEHKFVSSAGEVPIPPHIVERLDAVPKRKDGRYDERCRETRRAKRWEYRAESLIISRWLEGLETSAEDLPPYE